MGRTGCLRHKRGRQATASRQRGSLPQCHHQRRQRPRRCRRRDLTEQRRISALGVSSPSSTDDPSRPPHDSEAAALFSKWHGGGDEEDGGEAEEGLLRRRKRRLLFPSLSSASASLPALPQKQQQQQRRRGPSPTLPRPRLCRCSPLISRFCRVVLLALAAVFSLCVLADLSGAALYSRTPGLSPDARFWDRWEAALLRKAAGAPLTLPLERHWLEAKRELVARRWRTVAAAAAGSLRSGSESSGGGEGIESAPPPLLAFPPSLPAFLSLSCSHLLDDYAPLIAADLRPWPLIKKEMVDSDPDRLYFVQGRAFLPKEANRGRLMPTFHAFLQRLSLRVALPDLVIPLNVADEPRAPWEAAREWGSEHALGDPAALLRGGGVGKGAPAATAEKKKKSSGKVDSSEDSEGEWSSRSSSWWPVPLLKKKSKETESGDGKAATTATTAKESRHRSSSSPSPPPPDPLFSFCKTRDYSDILLPNTIEGDVFVRPRDGSKKKKAKNILPLDVAATAPSEEALRLLLPRVTFAATSVTTHRKTRAGSPADRRPATAVWRGSTGGFGGLAKGRAALLELGQKRPDLLDSGVYDWDEGKWGPAEGRVKPRMGLADQVDGHK